MQYPDRVLLIDDDADDCLVFGLSLREISPRIEFHCEQDSEFALAQLNDPDSPRPGIIFLDWNMPKLNGMQCLAAIRKNPRYDDIPIIIFTTSDAKQDKDLAHQLGASYFFSKPATLGELIKALEVILTFDWHGRLQ